MQDSVSQRLVNGFAARRCVMSDIVIAVLPWLCIHMSVNLLVFCIETAHQTVFIV